MQYRISQAKDRIFIASLYIGKEESELVRFVLCLPEDGRTAVS